MTTVATSGGVRAYARHRGCTHRAVQNAIRRRRLDKSVVDGKVVDFELADQEWEENRCRLAPPKVAKPTRAAATNNISALVDTVPLDHFSIFRIAGQLVMCITDPADDPGDPDQAMVFPLDDMVAINVALVLLRQAAPEWAACLAAHFSSTAEIEEGTR